VFFSPDGVISFRYLCDSLKESERRMSEVSTASFPKLEKDFANKTGAFPRDKVEQRQRLFFEAVKIVCKRRLWAVSTAHFSFGKLFVGMA